MWDKETEVDRYRERVPLQNLVSQWKMTMVEKTLPPRDFTAGLQKGEFIIIPECKKMEPGQSSFRKRYDPDTLASQFAKGGAPLISVNADPLLVGGTLDHVTSVRGAVANSPILASDLVLYPYQLYKLRLAGADAVTLLAGALAEKDLRYLTKIAKSLGLGVFVTVTTEVQMEAVTEVLDDASLDGLILSNRDLETFLVDETGKQVLDLLDGDAMKAWREKFVGGKVLVEGRVGAIGDGAGRATYIRDVKERGADGCIMGRGLAVLDEEDGETAYKLALEYLD
jgi:indole-3-glycerol phosphate synthase